jgi:hypothetical protein
VNEHLAIAQFDDGLELLVELDDGDWAKVQRIVDDPSTTGEGVLVEPVGAVALSRPDAPEAVS